MLEEGPSSASTRESGLGGVLTSPAAGVEPPPPKLEPMLVCFLRGGEMPPVWSPPPSALFITKKCLGLQQSWKWASLKNNLRCPDISDRAF